MKRIVTATALAIVVFLGISSLVLSAGLTSLGFVKLTSIESVSMTPTVPLGSLAIGLRTPFSQIKENDVVISQTAGTNSQDTVGRIKSIQHLRGTVYEYALKGDKNPLPDNWVYKTSSDGYVMKAAVPIIGYLVNAIKSPIGAIVYLLLVLSLVILYLKVFHSPTSHETLDMRRRLKEQRAAKEKEMVVTFDDLLAMGDTK